MRNIHSIIVTVLLSFLPLWLAANPAERHIKRGDSLMARGEFTEAINEYYHVKTAYQKGQITGKQAAMAMKNGGNACYNSQCYIEALEFYTTGLEAGEQAGDYKCYNACLGNIGNVYGIFQDYEKAISYYEKGMENSIRHNDNDMTSRFIVNLISVYSQSGDADKAEEFFRQSENVPMSDSVMKGFYRLMTQGQIATARSNHYAAAYYYTKALEWAIEHDMPKIFIISQYKDAGRAKVKCGNVADGLLLLDKGTSLAKTEKQDSELMEIYQYLIEHYRQCDDSKNERIYRAEYQKLNDSIMNHRRFYAAQKGLQDYERRTNTEHIKGLNEKIDIQWWMIITISAILLVTVILMIVVIIQKRTLKAAFELLVAKNEELTISDDNNRQLREAWLERESPTSGSEASAAASESPAARNKYEPTPEQTVRILNDIAWVMGDETVISNHDFSLPMLANMIKSNVTYVSWVINNSYRKNFKTFLNEYRIKEASKRLADTEHYGHMTIQAIAESVGFNSASVFIRSFRNVVGMTPSEYQKIIRKKQDSR